MRQNGDRFVYTATDPELDALYLMYDLITETAELAVGTTVGPVHFHNGGSFFDVFFEVEAGEPGVIVFKDGFVLDLSGPAGGEPSMQGAVGFGPSPNSATPHNMFELEVLFDGSNGSLNGHSHGQ